MAAGDQMDRMKDLLFFFLAAMAMVAVVCAIYEAMNQRNASALTLATIFLLSTLLFYLPRLETLSALGISVKLQNTLNQAEEIIDRLKKLAEVNAKVTYMTIAWGNRMGTPKAVDKQRVLDEMDAQLLALKVNEDERRKISKPLVALIGIDLYAFYSQVMERLVFWKDTIENRALNANHTPEAAAEYQKLGASIAAWRRLNAGKAPGNDLDNFDLREYLIRDTPVAILDEKQKASAETFRNQILSLYQGCLTKGGYTAEAATFIDGTRENYVGAADERVKQLFELDIDTGPH
jgi:hypothetical protein